jgi:hypothetical protein
MVLRRYLQVVGAVGATFFGHEQLVLFSSKSVPVRHLQMDDHNQNFARVRLRNLVMMYYRKDVLSTSSSLHKDKDECNFKVIIRDMRANNGKIP